MINITETNNFLQIENTLTGETHQVSMFMGNFDFENNTFELFNTGSIKRYNIGKVENINGFSTNEELINYFTLLFPKASEIQLVIDNKEVSYQNPLPISSFSVFSQDIWKDQSTSANWLNSEGFESVDNILVPFENLHTTIKNNVGTIKTLLVHFNRTINAQQIGIGAITGNYSNVLIKLLGSGNTERTVFDDSANSEQRNSFNYSFEPQLFNAIQIEFHTTNEVSISNFTIQKSTSTDTFIKAQKPDNTVQPVKASQFGNLQVAIKEIVSDSFGRVKTSSPVSMLDSVISHDTTGIYLGFLTNGLGAVNYDQVNATYTHSVTNNGDYSIGYTLNHGKYQPGKSLENIQSANMKTEALVTKFLGYADFDDFNNGAINSAPKNGILFYNESGNLSFKIFKNGINTETKTQTEWSIDKFNGTGASGVNLNMTGNVLPWIDLQFLAVGRVRCGFNIFGENLVAHEFYHTNIEEITETYMQTANLRVVFGIESLGGAGTLKQIGYSLISGGGLDPLGLLGSITNTNEVSISNAATELMLGMRLKADFFNSNVKILSAKLLALSNANGQWYLSFNPTYNNVVTWQDVPNSSIQFAENNNNEVSDLGMIISSDFISNNTDISGSAIDNALRLYKDYNGNFAEIWLIVNSFGNETFRGIINYKDLF